MSILATFPKDPNAVLDYTLDWALWLNGDTISTSTWTVPAGITNVLATKTTTATTIWISAGTLATSYSVVNKIVTTNGRTEERTIVFALVAR